MIYAQVETENRQPLEDELRNAQDAKWYRRLKIIDLSRLMFVRLTRTFGIGVKRTRNWENSQTAR